MSEDSVKQAMGHITTLKRCADNKVKAVKQSGRSARAVGDNKKKSQSGQQRSDQTGASGVNRTPVVVVTLRSATAPAITRRTRTSRK